MAESGPRNGPDFVRRRLNDWGLKKRRGYCVNRIKRQNRVNMQKIHRKFSFQMCFYYIYRGFSAEKFNATASKVRDKAKRRHAFAAGSERRDTRDD